MIDMNNIDLTAAATAARTIIFYDIATEVFGIVLVHIELIQIGEQFALFIEYRTEPIDFIAGWIDIRLLWAGQ